MPTDRKYGNVTVPGIPGDEPIFILRARDIAAAQTIADYAARCEAVGSPQDHVDAAQEVHAAFRDWAYAYPDRMKVPD